MSPEFRAGERVVSLAHLYPCCECGGNSNAYACFDGPEGKEFICEACANDEREDANENLPEIVHEFEDDGQPTEYEEWQDFMGGDDDPRGYDYDFMQEYE